MARLTTRRRNSLPAADFAGSDRSYPVDTPGRAVAAKGRATQAVKAGRMSPAEAERIDAKANRELKHAPTRRAANRTRNR